MLMVHYLFKYYTRLFDADILKYQRIYFIEIGK